MSSSLLAHFVDGSDVEVKCSFDERRIEISAYDEKTRHRYVLEFDQCIEIQVAYTEDDDLNNFTEGVIELTNETAAVRQFQIGFADGSVLGIRCRRFSMMQVEGKGWSWG